MRKYGLELLLIVAVALLIGQLFWPSVARWWRLPRPGSVGIDEFAATGMLAAEFAIYLPQDYDNATKWPLVVFLHGSGERGNDPARLHASGLFRGMRDGLKLPAVVVAPQCLPNASWEPAAIVQFLDHLVSAYRVDRERIYLIGYSMGGYGTWRTAAAYPEQFAAIVPICGGGDPDRAASLAGMPIWAFHGAKDEVVPLSRSQRMIDAIRVAGGEPQLTILRDAGHGICEEVCRRDELWKWLLQQRLLDREQREYIQERIPPVTNSR